MGSDCFQHFSETWIHYFNPRSRMGSDKKVLIRTVQPNNFNPRSRMGSDS